MKRTIQTNIHPDMDARWITQQFCLFINATAKNKGITHESIADQTGLKRANVTRALNGSHTPTLQTVVKIAGVVGVQMTFSVPPLEPPKTLPTKIQFKPSKHHTS